MSMKRTRPIRGKYFLTIPRVAIQEPGVYEIKVKLSQVIIKKVKEIHEAKTEKVYARGEEYLPGSPGSIAPPSKGEIERGRVDGEEEG